MPDFKRLADKAREFLDQRQDQVGAGIKKVGDFADKRTGGRYSNQIQHAQSYLGGGKDQQQDQGGQDQGQDQDGAAQ